MKFEVDKANKTIDISRDFEASQSNVWHAFTTKEGLDAWWAPAPWKSKTTQMDFVVGGKRIYAMVGPAGEEHWAVQIFTAISAQDSFGFEDAFSDKDGIVNAAMPSMHWSLNFSSSGAQCTVAILIKAQSLEALEQIIQMGFKEGFTMTLDALAAQLSSSKK
ncbi:MAG: SRPBCC domain-containing protein [Spirochaetes bacterium]|nr:SRPBCC domain-containing protein [Spirochaetota bacterium]